MPTYIRVKQIDQDELREFFLDSITSNSGELIDYINENAINLTGDNFISGNKYFNNNILVSGTGSFLELYVRSNSNTDTGVRFIVTGDNFALLNRSGVKFRIDNIEASPYTGRNTIELNNTNTTLKFPSNRNDFIAVDTEVVHKTGVENISGNKNFINTVNFSGGMNINTISSLNLSGISMDIRNMLLNFSGITVGRNVDSDLTTKSEAIGYAIILGGL